MDDLLSCPFRYSSLYFRLKRKNHGKLFFYPLADPLHSQL